MISGGAILAAFADLSNKNTVAQIESAVEQAKGEKPPTPTRGVKSGGGAGDETEGTLCWISLSLSLVRSLVRSLSLFLSLSLSFSTLSPSLSRALSPSLLSFSLSLSLTFSLSLSLKLWKCKQVNVGAY